MPTLQQFPTIEPVEVHAIQHIVENQLRSAGVLGILPTPIGAVMDALGIRRYDDLKEVGHRYVETLPDNEAANLRRALHKTRGMADLGQRAVYLPSLESQAKNFWRDAHELSHLTFPWHKLHDDYIYGDDKDSLCERAHRRLECEANVGAKSYIFQNGLFSQEANDCSLNFQNILTLSERYGASIEATFLAFVGARADACVGITYLPSRVVATDGLPRLYRPWIVTSSSFNGIELGWAPPDEARTDWAQARVENECKTGEAARMKCGDSIFYFDWSAFWNQYKLMVLLRHRQPPTCIVDAFVRNLITPSVGQSPTKVIVPGTH